jgi:hypothetical protein
MLKRLAKKILGLLLLPFCAGFTWQLGGTMFSIPYKPDVPYYFVAGALVYLTLHVLFHRPILTYVFGHELTHALFTLLFGGAVKSFRVSERGGQVAITKSNFVITLAPYFFPLYTFLAVITEAALNMAGMRAASGFLIFISGGTFAFHLVLTVLFLQNDQKDIREEGAIFSYPLIYLFNILFAALLLHLLLAQKNGFLDFIGNGIILSVRFSVLFLARMYALLEALLRA